MKFKVGDRVRIKPTLNTDDTTPDCWVSAKMIIKRGQIYPIVKITSCGLYGLDLDNSKDDCWWFTEDMLEPADSKTLRMADGTVIGEFAKEGIIGEFKGMPVYATGGTVSIHDLPTNEWYNPMRLAFKNGSSIEALPNTSDIIRNTSDEIKKMEEKKMPTKFTFYFNVNEGTRVDKSCNGTIPTITTSVVLDKFGDPDRRKCYSLEGEATCDKADYDMRQGVLEALANAVFDGNFEKAYDKTVKTNAFCERQDRTCHYCGKVLDTIEEKQEHEAWHVERKKARRECYLLRKRAKEIAFEEAAQKMAKEIIAEDNKK